MKLKKSIKAIIIFLFIILFSPTLTAKAEGDTNIYRLYNPNSGEHFFTSSPVEFDSLGKTGWIKEGIAWKTPVFSDYPVHRLYNPNTGDHHYTISVAEGNALIDAGWFYEGTAWYSADDKGIPVYRVYNPNATGAGAHHYTLSEGEKTILESVGWSDEKTGFFCAGEPEDVSISIQYDDRYDISQLFPGYYIAKTENIRVDSFNVFCGRPTDNPDSDVCRKISDTALYASGTGECIVYVQNGKETKTLNVTVKPAPLTLMFIAGQSNAEGCTPENEAHPENSVLNERGKVYSTYFTGIRNMTGFFEHISGYSNWANNPDQYVPGSLSRDNSLSINGNTIGQRGESSSNTIDDLTDAGKGKPGPDSGLAYEYNRLTGEKVWVVNGALGSSSIRDWDEENMALGVFLDVVRVYNAEIEAGHYTPAHRYMIWLQGERDTLDGMNAFEYIERFTRFSDRYMEALNIEKIGIISVRNGNDTPDEDGTWTSDIENRDARTAQIRLCLERSDIVMASRVNENWISDEMVSEYFSAAYPNGFSYPLRSNNTIWGIPNTVAEVHPGLHYTQVGHNENGITAARGLFSP